MKWVVKAASLTGRVAAKLKQRGAMVVAALSLLALTFVPALAAGMWGNWVLFGSAAFCSSQNLAGVPGVAAICTTTTPAGPTVLTGLETIPVDTNKTGGAMPQSMRLPLAAIGALPVTIVAGSSAATNTLSATAVTGGYIVTGSSALSPVVITLPASPVDQQEFVISATQNIASLIVNTGGTATVLNKPTALTTSTTAAYGYKYSYDSANNTWYRNQ